MPSTRHFDLAVIGSGSGNSLLTEDLAGWDIAVIERSTFGGTCLNVGCIPTKMYVYAADIANDVRTAGRFGVDAHLDGVRWADIRNRVFGRIDPVSAGGRQHRRTAERVTLFEGHAEFSAERALVLSTGEHLSADHVVIATGSRATVPPVIADSGVPFHTSDTVMRLPRLPARLAIVGGGYIAAEFAHVFSALGADVTIVTRGSTLLGRLDEEISARFTALARQRWDVRLDADLAAVSSVGEPGDDATIRLELADGARVEVDTLLIATGRIPNSDRLNLAAAGVEVGAGGRITVDEYQRTTAAHVWALGDVTSEHQLKHVANQDSRVVAHNLAHPHDLRASNHSAVPAAVFTEPQIASVGLTERDARTRGIPFVSAVQTFGSTAYGWAMEDTTGVCKLLADPATGLLLGAHMMGPQSSVLIQPLIQAMAFGQRVADVATGQYWIHPALTEVVENALLKLDLGSVPPVGRIAASSV